MEHFDGTNGLESEQFRFVPTLFQQVSLCSNSCSDFSKLGVTRLAKARALKKLYIS
jgi:hypothetical protein